MIINILEIKIQIKQFKDLLLSIDVTFKFGLILI